MKHFSTLYVVQRPGYALLIQLRTSVAWAKKTLFMIDRFLYIRGPNVRHNRETTEGEACRWLSG